MSVRIRYDYVSWQRLFPGYGVDLTGLRFEPPDDYRAGAEAALKQLRLGRSPKVALLAEIRDGLSAALAAAVDLESCYAAVFFPRPKRSADHLWLEFTAYDNTGADLSPKDVLGPVRTGPGRSDESVRFPGRTICGSSASGRTLFAIRSYATAATLTDLLDDMVAGWAAGLVVPD